MASLKSFIKAVRKAKTIADERNVVMKESAAIRTSFKDTNLDQNSRRISISKLLYLYIMGEKTHFGQVECIKLLASPRFTDKRLGYLATMLLLDENQEVLTLLTNSLDNDMQHNNSYVNSLALCCLGNLASPELARDLYTNVEKLMGSTNPYLRKKSLIVAAKLIDKDPELGEFFIDKLPQLIIDKSSGVLLGCLTLIKSLYNIPSFQPTLIKLSNQLLSILKKLNTSGYNPDYDVLGINDPFLQTELISVLRLFSTHESFNKVDEFNDILTQICSNIEIGKNVNHSILYECIRTIFLVGSDQSLKILAINILGKFLTTKDNNTRYIALNTLLKVINIEPQAVQRHRSIIVGCLNDGDISIRRRALELTFAILNESNIRVLIKEILKFLSVTNDNDLKPFIIQQLILSIDKYSPNDSWKFDNFIKILEISSNFINLQYISQILGNLIRVPNDLKVSVIEKVYKTFKEAEIKNQFGLSIVIIWSLGEYYDIISNPEINENSVLSLFHDIINNSVYSSSERDHLINYALISSIKLSSKFSNTSSLESLRKLLLENTSNTNLEIQIRSIEFSELLTTDSKLKKSILSKVPPPPIKERQMLSLTQNEPTTKAKSYTPEPNDLLDLAQESKNDLLSDIFDSKPKPAKNDILDLFDNVPKVNSGIKAFENADLSLTFVPKQISGGQATIDSKIVTTKTIENLQFLIAVPKSQKLTISTNPNTNMTMVNAGDLVLQNIKLLGKEGSKIKFRIKISYSVNGEAKDQQFDFSGFEQNL